MWWLWKGVTWNAFIFLWWWCDVKCCYISTETVYVAPLHPRLLNQPIVPSLLSTGVGRISLITLRGVKGSVSLWPVVFTCCMASWWRLMPARDQCRLIAAISRLVDTQPSTSTSPHPRIHYGVMDHGCEIFMKAKKHIKPSETNWVILCQSGTGSTLVHSIYITISNGAGIIIQIIIQDTIHYIAYIMLGKPWIQAVNNYCIHNNLTTWELYVRSKYGILPKILDASSNEICPSRNQCIAFGILQLNIYMLSITVKSYIWMNEWMNEWMMVGQLPQ